MLPVLSAIDAYEIVAEWCNRAGSVSSVLPFATRSAIHRRAQSELTTCHDAKPGVALAQLVQEGADARKALDPAAALVLEALAGVGDRQLERVDSEDKLLLGERLAGRVLLELADVVARADALQGGGAGERGRSGERNVGGKSERLGREAGGD